MKSLPTTSNRGVFQPPLYPPAVGNRPKGRSDGPGGSIRAGQKKRARSPTMVRGSGRADHASALAMLRSATPLADWIKEQRPTRLTASIAALMVRVALDFVPPAKARAERKRLQLDEAQKLMEKTDGR